MDTDTGEHSGRLLGGVTSVTQRSTKSRRRSAAATTAKATPTWRNITTCIPRDLVVYLANKYVMCLRRTVSGGLCYLRLVSVRVVMLRILHDIRCEFYMISDVCLRMKYQFDNEIYLACVCPHIWVLLATST